jgi:hypothetical protein
MRYFHILSLLVGVFLGQIQNGVCQEVLESNRPNTYGPDYIAQFYERLKQSDVQFCEDRTKMLPGCQVCIPGLVQSSVDKEACDTYIPGSMKIRNEIEELTKERYATMPQEKDRYPRPFGLYPYLEKGDFMVRQEIFAEKLEKYGAKNVVDIGAYYNPIHFFVKKSVCFESVVIVEPILDALSAMIPCDQVAHPGKKTHVLFLPVTFRFYARDVARRMPSESPDSIVCIGCDGHYGPSRRMLEDTFPRPFTIYLEFPTEYYHNPPFNKMMGRGPNEEMLYHMLLRPHTNETTYTKRAMKIIKYNP